MVANADNAECSTASMSDQHDGMPHDGALSAQRNR